MYSKTNEITAIPELLDALEVARCTVTIDAMGCQKEIASKIIARKADYVLAVKENQGHLREDIEYLFDLSRNDPTRCNMGWVCQNRGQGSWAD